MRTLAREKVNEKNMITNYDAHGFMVAAEELPKACTAKPQDAAKFVAIRGHDEVAVIEVILPANKVKESFDHSVQFFQCKAFMYEEDIKVRPNAEVVEYSFK